MMDTSCAAGDRRFVVEAGNVDPASIPLSLYIAVFEAWYASLVPSGSHSLFFARAICTATFRARAGPSASKSVRSSGLVNRLFM